MLSKAPRPIIVVCGLVGAALLAGCQRPPVTAVALVPAPFERPPFDPAATQKAVEFWAWKARQDSQGAIEYGKLSGAYLQRCRETGDIADAIKAEQAARRSLSIRTRNNYSAYDMLALSLLTQHRFTEASRLAERTCVARPDDAQARYLDIEAAIEMGDYDKAQRQLNQPHLNQPQSATDSPFSFALRARLCEMEGRPQAALAYLHSAQKQADQDIDLSRPAVAWFHMRSGDLLAAMGSSDQAEAAYREALGLYPRDYKTMTSLCRLAACRKQWQQAINWGRQAAEIVPAPDTLALMGDAYASSGQPKAAEQQYRLIDAIANIARAQGGIYDRQRALYYADHDRNLPQALALARRELMIRHDVYAYDTLAWAAYKNGRFADADQAARKAMQRGTQDALMYYHAGIIAIALDQPQRARELLVKALAINPQFHPYFADAAHKSLAGLGDRT